MADGMRAAGWQTISQRRERNVNREGYLGRVWGGVPELDATFFESCPRGRKKP
jgi:hypothetical protein